MKGLMIVCGAGIPAEWQAKLENIAQFARIEAAAESAKALWFSARLLAEGQGTETERLELAADILKDGHDALGREEVEKMGLHTPADMLARLLVIAALPKPVEIKDDGSVYVAALHEATGWAELPLSDEWKAGMAKAKLAKSGAANQRPA